MKSLYNSSLSESLRNAGGRCTRVEENAPLDLGTPIMQTNNSASFSGLPNFNAIFPISPIYSNIFQYTLSIFKYFFFTQIFLVSWYFQKIVSSIVLFVDCFCKRKFLLWFLIWFLISKMSRYQPNLNDLDTQYSLSSEYHLNIIWITLSPIMNENNATPGQLPEL